MLYDESDYFCKMRAYAEATGEVWFILSAKHGLVDPDTEIEPYDAYGLSDEQARNIANEVSQQADYVEIVAGKAYTEPLIQRLENKGVTVTERCGGMKIGERIQRLDELIAELDHKTLC